MKETMELSQLKWFGRSERISHKRLFKSYYKVILKLLKERERERERVSE